VKIARIAIGLVALGSVAFGATTAFGSTGGPANGVIQVFVHPTNNTGLRGSIVVTGAIGDYGKYLSINQAGKADANGDFVRITLQKGGFEVNSTALNAIASKAQPTFDSTTCSGFLEVSGPNTLLDGTGLYAGISGTITVTETAAYVGPRYKSGKNKGQCDVSNSSQPLASYSSITGVGPVTF
jgi:hypothetical protein